MTCFAVSCSIFRITFSETPPVFSKPKVPRKLSRDSGWESVWEDHFPDHEEKLLKNFFLKSASETCRAKLGEEYAKTRAEIDSLHSVNKELLEKQEDLATILKDGEMKNDSVESYIGSLQSAKGTLERISADQSRELTEADVDHLVEVPGAVDAQIVELVAADEAIKDCVYALGRVLDADQLDLELYLKRVRELSRKQFSVRQKIVNLEQMKE